MQAKVIIREIIGGLFYRGLVLVVCVVIMSSLEAAGGFLSPRSMESKRPESMMIIGASLDGALAAIEMLQNLKVPEHMSIIYLPHINVSSVYHALKVNGQRVHYLAHGVFIEPGSIYIGRRIEDNDKVFNDDTGLNQYLDFTVNDMGIVCQLDGHKISAFSILEEAMIIASDIFKEKCIGVVLEGSSNDGQSGIAHIKKNRGLVIAQKPLPREEFYLDEDEGVPDIGMPAHAIASGKVDIVIPLSKLERAIQNIVSIFLCDDLDYIKISYSNAFPSV